MARSVLLAYAIAASLFAAGIVFKVPGFYDELGEGREAAMGQNPNAVAANSAIAIVIIIGFLLSVLRRRLPLMLLSLPLFAAIVAEWFSWRDSGACYRMYGVPITISTVQGAISSGFFFDCCYHNSGLSCRQKHRLHGALGSYLL